MLGKKKNDAIDLAFQEMKKVEHALEEEGKTSGERSYFEFVALTLIDLEFTLRRISFMLAVLIGLISVEFITKLF